MRSAKNMKEIQVNIFIVFNVKMLKDFPSLFVLVIIGQAF